MIDPDILKCSDMGEDKLEHVQEVMQKAPEGYFLEIGTRLGGSAMLAMAQDHCYTSITVDPWGAKPYPDMNGTTSNSYDETMAREAMLNLSRFAVKSQKNHIHYRTEAKEFWGIDHSLWLFGSCYRLQGLKFSFVLLDGEHNDEAVLSEIEVLKQRLVPGGVILVDNTDWLSVELEGWEAGRPDMRYKIFK